MTRLLLVGAGKIAALAHLPALRTLQSEGLVEVVVCDLDRSKAEALAAQFEMEAATDWTEAAPTADAVAITVPPGPNAELAIAAAGRGLHVLCEKPPGRTRAQAEAMAAAARPDRVSMVGFNRRSAPLYRDAMARSMELGAPTSFYGRMSRAAMGQPPSDTASDWITSDSSHALDLAVATIGFPRAVSVSRRSVGSSDANVFSLHLHADGGSAVLVLHYAAARRMERYEWAGPGYDVALAFPSELSWAQVGGDEVTTELGPARPGTVEFATSLGFTGEYRAFLQAITGDGPRPDWDFAYAADFMRLVDTILEAPDGTLAPVGRSQPATTAPRPTVEAATGAGRTAAAAGAPSTRPSVLTFLPPSVQHRFFRVEDVLELERRCDVRAWSSGGDGAGALEEAEIVITGRGASPLPRDFVERARQLRLMVVLGASVRHYQAEALIERGVVVANTADAVAQSVAEHCLVLTLAGLRRLTEDDAAMHRGEWPRPGGAAGRSPLLKTARALVPVSMRPRLWKLMRRGTSGGGGGRGGGGAATTGRSDLQGARVGLIGWSYTARRFVELLEPFGCDLLVFSEAADPAELEEIGARPAPMGEILGSCNVISLHRGLNERTRGFLDRSRLDLIRPGSVLVNTARGELVVEDDLVGRLQRGDIVAALDVFAEEPLPKANPLRSLPNVILTPHNASSTLGEERRMGDQAIRTILDWVDGNKIAAIDVARYSRMT